MDPRHQQRIKIVQELYSLFFNKNSPLSTKTKLVINKQKIIDQKIKNIAQKYELAKVAKVDLSILRLSVYELIIEKKEPPKAIINEAIEIAKELAGEKSPAFINAVLGKIYQEIK